MTSPPTRKPTPQDETGVDDALRARRGELAEALGLPSADALPLVSLPANRTRIRPLPERRRKHFLAHLNRVVDEAFATVPSHPTEPAHEEDGTSPWLGEACGTCRGRYCHAGGDHAFLDVVTIHAYRHDHPEATRDEVVDAYASRLGDAAYDRGCVYQADGGCRLPRTMRARICNTFLCTPLHELRSLETTQAAHVLLAAHHGDKLVRLTLVATSAPPRHFELDDE